MNKKATGKPPNDRRTPAAGRTASPKANPTEGTGNSGDRLALVRELILKLADDLKRDTTKSRVAELARLLTLEKELSEGTEAVREIKVTWVESGPAESSKSE